MFILIKKTVTQYAPIRNSTKLESRVDLAGPTVVEPITQCRAYRACYTRTYVRTSRTGGVGVRVSVTERYIGVRGVLAIVEFVIKQVYLLV